MLFRSGFYSFIPIIIIYIISIIKFYHKEYGIIEKQIDEIVEAKIGKKKLKKRPRRIHKPKKEYKPKKGKNTIFKTYLNHIGLVLDSNYDETFTNTNTKMSNLTSNTNIKRRNKLKRKRKYTDINDNNNTTEDEVIPSINLDRKKRHKKKYIEINRTFNSPPIKKSKRNQMIVNEYKNYTTSLNDETEEDKSKNKLVEINVFSEEQKQKIKEILKPNDSEINNFGYKKAIKYDHRTYFQYYSSLIKTKYCAAFADYCVNKK